jgi:hypothetical protein
LDDDDKIIDSRFVVDRSRNVKYGLERLSEEAVDEFSARDKRRRERWEIRVDKGTAHAIEFVHFKRGHRVPQRRGTVGVHKEHSESSDEAAIFRV